jgi:cytochrome c oxidase cbb3-type subunit 3
LPTKIEKDAHSGIDTTGHVWDGIKELNTPLPKWWLYVLFATIVFGVGQMILYPSVTWYSGYWHGLLGYSQRERVDHAVAEVAAQRATVMDRLAKLPFAEIKADPELLSVALVAGSKAFANNCQPCHGAGGGGRVGYPALAAGAWIWGGTLDDIERTIIYGVRSGLDEARGIGSVMPAFGHDAILKPAEIGQVADYVMTLYGDAEPGKDVETGKQLFADNCAICHGENGEGNREVGAPRLASKVHLNAAARAAVVAQITNPRLGVMPNWNTRLDPGTIKALALYVHGLGGGE